MNRESTVGLIALGAGAVALFAASGSVTATERRRPSPPSSLSPARNRFAEELRRMGADPSRLSEADWRIIDQLMIEHERIQNLPPEQTPAAIEEATRSAAARAYVEMMLRRFPDVFPDAETLMRAT